MKTIICLALASFLLAFPARSQSNPDGAVFLADFLVSSQHQVIKLKIAQQTSFFLNEAGHFIREGLNSRFVRYGTFGMMAIVGLCLLISVGETESEEGKVNVSARRSCFSRRKRSVNTYRPSERKRWIRRVKGNFRRQVQPG